MDINDQNEKTHALRVSKSKFTAIIVAIIVGVIAIGCFSGLIGYYIAPAKKVSVRSEVVVKTVADDFLPSVDEQEVDIISKAIAKITLIEITTASSTGHGSGVIYSFDENQNKVYVITNNHVVEGADKITLTSPNGIVYSNVSLIGSDPYTDLAVVAFSPTSQELNAKYDISGITFNKNATIGQTAIAIGYPITPVLSVSRGIISALDYDITISGFTMNSLVTDAAINSGNSGGGLFDANGNLLGIVNAKTVSTQVEGRGYAIPSETVSTIVKQLIENNGEIHGRATLGFNTELTSVIVQSGIIPTSAYYVKVSTISSGLQIESGTLLQGDLIRSASINDNVAINLEEYRSNSDNVVTVWNQSILQQIKSGDTITLSLYRKTDGEYTALKTVTKVKVYLS